MPGKRGSVARLKAAQAKAKQNRHAKTKSNAMANHRKPSAKDAGSKGGGAAAGAAGAAAAPPKLNVGAPCVLNAAAAGAGAGVGAAPNSAPVLAAPVLGGTDAAAAWSILLTTCVRC